MNKLLYFIILMLICQACNLHGNQKKYTITLYRDQFVPSLNQRRPFNIIDSINADNDTAAYLTALKEFYNQKIKERKIYNWGEPKSFTITDHNGTDLSIKLSGNTKNELKNQVTNIPEVKKVLDAYKRDSI